MRSLPRWLPVLSLLFVTATCGEGDPVQETCELLFSCGCAAVPYADVDACVADFNDELDLYRAGAEAEGLTFARDCVDRSLAWYTDQLECGTDYEPIAGACSPCAPIHGDKPIGAACTTRDAGYSDCAKHLYCNEGTCMDPCERLAAGAVCAVDNGMGIESAGYCGADLYCDHADTLTCKPVIKAGGACPDNAGCATDLFCDSALTCRPVPDEGEACESFCQPHLVCADGSCEPGPGAGEPCPGNGDCGPGTRCDFDTFVCVVEDPLVCEFGSL